MSSSGSSRSVTGRPRPAGASSDSSAARETLAPTSRSAGLVLFGRVADRDDADVPEPPADDEADAVDPLSSACATGVPRAVPTPRKTASAPTRPTNLAYPCGWVGRRRIAPPRNVVQITLPLGVPVARPAAQHFH